MTCDSCIIVMAAMRLEKLRHVDLNLLITFAAIAEEKSVTAAASRLLLSQPAVSRALQRARGMFQDDRHMASNSPSGAARVSQSYRGYYPRWRISLRRSGSIQRGRRATFVISGPDNICTVVLPRLLRQYAKGRYQVQFEFLQWGTDKSNLCCTSMTDSCPSQFHSRNPSRVDVERGGNFLRAYGNRRFGSNLESREDLNILKARS